MKILVLAYLRNEQNALYFKRFLDLLNNIDRDITLLTSGHNSIFFNESTIKEDDLIIPDIIIAFNRRGLIKAKKINKSYNVPLIFSFCNSDIESEYNGKWNEWNNLIVINDNNNIITKLFPDYFTTFLNLPFQYGEYRPTLFDKKKLTIYVGFDDLKKNSSILFEIAPVINSLSQVKFIIIGKGNMLLNHFNTNVQLNSRNIQFEDADLVIGSGTVIEKAIACSKPCIVVGPRGFGGWVTKANLEKQLTTGFQGRIGGNIGEYIPDEILKDEIFDFMDMEQKQIQKVTNENHKLLQKYYGQTIEQLLLSLTNIIKDHKTITEDLLSTKLQVSQIFTLRQINDKQYIIQKRDTKQYHSILDGAEYKVISEFINVNHVSDVIAKCGYDNDAETFLEFIRELINEKILKLPKVNLGSALIINNVISYEPIIFENISI